MLCMMGVSWFSKKNHFAPFAPFTLLIIFQNRFLGRKPLEIVETQGARWLVGTLYKNHSNNSSLLRRCFITAKHFVIIVGGLLMRAVRCRLRLLPMIRLRMRNSSRRIRRRRLRLLVRRRILRDQLISDARRSLGGSLRAIECDRNRRLMSPHANRVQT